MYILYMYTRKCTVLYTALKINAVNESTRGKKIKKKIRRVGGGGGKERERGREGRR